MWRRDKSRCQKVNGDINDNIGHHKLLTGPGWLNCQVAGLPNNSYKPITNTVWVRVQLCKLQKGCIRLAAASDKVYQLLAHGRWFSSGTLASSTTKTGRHDIAEIFLKVALNTKIKSIKSYIGYRSAPSLLKYLFNKVPFL